MKKLLKNKYFSWVWKITITVLFVYFVNRQNTMSELKSVVEYFSVYSIIAALFFSVAAFYFQVKRWEIILRFQEFSVDNNIALKTLLWGNLLAFITPARFGELFRGIQISSGKKGDSLFAVVIDKLFIIITVLVTGFICVAFQISVLKKSVNSDMYVFLVVAFVICAIGIFILSTGKLFDEKHLITRCFNKILTHLPRVFMPAGKKAVLYSLGAHACLLIQTVILLRMFNCGTVFVDLLAVGMAYAIMPFLPSPIGNMGVREGSYTFFLTYLGAVCAKGTLTIAVVCLSTSILIFFMNLLLPAFIGMFWYYFDQGKGGSVNDEQTD